MMSIFIGCIMFLVLLNGLTFLSQIYLKLERREGYFLSAGGILILTSLASMIQFTYLSNIIIVMLSGLGYCLAEREGIRKKGKEIFTLDFMGLTLVCIFGILLFYKGHLHTKEEFMLWGKSIKTLYETGHFGAGYSLEGGVSSLYSGLSAFVVFFLNFTGYHENVIYLCVFVLSAAGILLPFHMDQPQAKIRLLLYLATLGVACFIFYEYGWYNLGPILPMGCWAGGTLSWYLHRGENHKNYIVFAVALLVIFLMCNNIGLMLDVILVAYVFFYEFRKQKESRKKDENKKNKHDRKEQRMGWTIIHIMIIYAVILCGFTIIITILNVDNSLFSKLFHIREMYHLFRGNPGMFGKFLSMIVGFNLGKYSTSTMAFLPTLILFACLQGILIALKKDSKEISTDTVFMILSGIVYVLMTYSTYCAYYVDVKEMTSRYVVRTFSAFVLMFLIVTLIEYLGTNQIAYEIKDLQILKGKKIQKISCCDVVMFLIFLYLCTGVGRNFIPYNTSWKEEAIECGKETAEVRKQVKEIQSQNPKGKIYLLNQSDQVKRKNLQDGVYPMIVADYYLGDRLSDYREESWKFTPRGCFIGEGYKKGSKLDQLGSAFEGYDYLWIYKNSETFSENLMQISGKMLYDKSQKSGYFYRIIREEDQIIDFELLK